MDQARALVKEIQEYCRAHADAQQAKKYERYFKEGYDAWGFVHKQDPLWNERQDAWLEKYQGLGLDGFIRAGALLFASGKYEEGMLAVRFVRTFKKELDQRALSGLAQWFESGVANWAHSDVLCGELLSPLLVKGKMATSAFEPWRKSEHKYQRRAAVVAQLGLAKAGRDIPRLLKFIRPLMLDQERVVQQGVGWVLREAWKKEPEPVEALLAEFKDTAPRLIFQYATEKMTAEQKARFKKAKK